MLKIESKTLEDAYIKASEALQCSISEIEIEIVQHASSGLLGMFSKKAIIIAVKTQEAQAKQNTREKSNQKKKTYIQETTKTEDVKKEPSKKVFREKKTHMRKEDEGSDYRVLNNTIMPESFVSDQDEDYYDDEMNFTADYDDKEDKTILDDDKEDKTILDDDEIIKEISNTIDSLFSNLCFNTAKIKIKLVGTNMLAIKIKGEDAALLIGKEGYRYKALSYIFHNWINTKYNFQVRLEVEEFVQNKEKSIYEYLKDIYEIVDKSGKTQTKLLSNGYIKIAMKELRHKYPKKYIATHFTKDNFKYIVISDYNDR